MEEPTEQKPMYERPFEPAVGNVGQQHDQQEEESHPPRAVIPRRQLLDRPSHRIPEYKNYELNFIEYETPVNFHEAVGGKDSPQWTEAVSEELKTNERNET